MPKNRNGFVGSSLDKSPLMGVHLCVRLGSCGNHASPLEVWEVLISVDKDRLETGQCSEQKFSQRLQTQGHSSSNVHSGGYSECSKNHQLQRPTLQLRQEVFGINTCPNYILDRKIFSLETILVSPFFVTLPVWCCAMNTRLCWCDSMGGGRY